MIYFIGGKKQREFKYFELLEKIRKENIGISESFFDVDLKENEKFLEKIKILDKVKKSDYSDFCCLLLFEFKISLLKTE